MKIPNPFTKKTDQRLEVNLKRSEDLSPKESKTIYFLIGFLVVLIVAAIIGVVIGANMIINYQRRVLPPAPAPLAEVPAVIPVGLKRHATDSAVLKVRDTIQSLQREINSADYFETEINPPVLDDNIRIEQR